MRVLEFTDVRRAYVLGRDVLHDVTFSVDAGRIVGLLGRNGAGKTTLMRIAMGMIEVQGGRVRLFGMDPRERAVEVKRRVGYVAEDQILPAFLKVREVIALHRTLFPTWDERLETELLERFRISSQSRVKALSKGQARQLALVCAIAHRPELLLLDEPAGGLDPAARREFLETSIRLLSESGTTVIFSSHHMGDVERIADRIVMLDEGTVLIDCPLDDLREQHTLAMIPQRPGVSPDRLHEIESCLGVRRRGESFHAIFRLEPASTAATLRHELGVADARCVSVALEEMFVELVGGR